MKTQFAFRFVPEHADEMQHRRFVERCILDSSLRAFGDFHALRVSLPIDTNALDSLASRLCRDIDPTKQTMESLTRWFQDSSRQ